MKRKLKLAIFDVDGLILDSEVFYAKAWSDAFNANSKDKYKVNEEVMTEWFYNNLSGKNIGKQLEFIEKEYPHNDIKTIYEEYRSLFRKRLLTESIKVKEGFFELINYLKNNNVILAIASTSKEVSIRNAFKNAGIDISIFDVLITGDMDLECKPSPQPYLKACEILNINPKDAIAFEDSNSGVLSATNANIDCFLVPGRAPVSEEVKNKAYAICDNLDDAIEILENIQ